MCGFRTPRLLAQAQTMSDQPRVPPRAYSGCTCECHSGKAAMHFAPCCYPRPGFDDLRPELQDKIDSTVAHLLAEKQQ